MTALSVVICTHNRYDALAASVARLVASSGFNDTDCELLVVDNTPARQRRAIALPEIAHAHAEFAHGELAHGELAHAGIGSAGTGRAHSSPGFSSSGLSSSGRVRVTVCETEGLSHARNQAIAESSGGIVAFLDDDALVSDDWCATILRRLDGDADIMAVGGRVTPLFQGGDQGSDRGGDLPAWYDGDDLSGYLSCIDWGTAPRFLRPGEWLVGANIAFRRAVFDTHGLFDAALGRRGAGSLLSNEETALLERIGLHRVFYDPAMAVEHVIPVERLTRRWFRRRVYWQAVSDLVAGGVRDDDPALRREYGEVICRLEPEHRNLNALTFDPGDRDTFRLQLRAIYLAAIVLGHGGVAE